MRPGRHGMRETPDGDMPMKVRDLYPLVTTSALFEARDFYVTHFGFEVVFEASWFVYLSGPAKTGRAARRSPSCIRTTRRTRPAPNPSRASA